MKQILYSSKNDMANYFSFSECRTNSNVEQPYTTDGYQPCIFPWIDEEDKDYYDCGVGTCAVKANITTHEIIGNSTKCAQDTKCYPGDKIYFLFQKNNLLFFYDPRE